MRDVLFVSFVLVAAPAFAQPQTPGPDTRYQRHQASEAFGDAGSSVAQAAREAGRGLEHGWQATKQAVESGWNKVTGDQDHREPAQTR
jgi:hypothetical protein